RRCASRNFGRERLDVSRRATLGTRKAGHDGRREVAGRDVHVQQRREWLPTWTVPASPLLDRELQMTYSVALVPSRSTASAREPPPKRLRERHPYTGSTAGNGGAQRSLEVLDCEVELTPTHRHLSQKVEHGGLTIELIRTRFDYRGGNIDCSRIVWW